MAAFQRTHASYCARVYTSRPLPRFSVSMPYSWSLPSTVLDLSCLGSGFSAVIAAMTLAAARPAWLARWQDTRTAIPLLGRNVWQRGGGRLGAPPVVTA